MLVLFQQLSFIFFLLLAGHEPCHAPIISNGNVSPSGWIRHRDSVTVTCDSGYTLSGNSRVYCTEGELSSIPSCTRTVVGKYIGLFCGGSYGRGFVEGDFHVRWGWGGGGDGSCL